MKICRISLLPLFLWPLQDVTGAAVGSVTATPSSLTEEEGEGASAAGGEDEASRKDMVRSRLGNP